MYSIFAITAAQMLQKKFEKIIAVNQCFLLVGQHLEQISYNDLFEWAESSHFCIPLSLADLIGRDEIREQTNVEAVLNPEQNEPD